MADKKKITISINKDIYKAIKLLAVNKESTFTHYVEEGLTLILEREKIQFKKEN